MFFLGFTVQDDLRSDRSRNVRSDGGGNFIIGDGNYVIEIFTAEFISQIAGFFDCDTVGKSFNAAAAENFFGVIMAFCKDD